MTRAERPLRLLVATDQWFPDFRGGSARVATETARRLAERGHEVLVIAPARRDLPTEETKGHLTLLRVLRRRGAPQTLADVAETARWAKRVQSWQPDVMVAHQVTVAAGLGAARMGAPLALVYHASAPRELRDTLERASRLGRRAVLRCLEPAVDLLDRRAVRNADTILALSDFTVSLLQEDHPRALRKVVTVSGGVDTTWFSPGEGPRAARRRLGLPAAERLIVAARRLEPRMGLERLVEALRLLPDVSLAVVGTGSLAAPLAELAVRTNVSTRVRFSGAVTDEQLRDWYRAADIVVMPTVAYEGFGLVTAEALACGTPVVGTAVGATPALLEPLSSHLVAADAAPDTLAATIARALGFADAQFRIRCREYALERFDWDSVICRWEAALRATGAASDVGLAADDS